jgi:hypothetical protein
VKNFAERLDQGVLPGADTAGLSTSWQLPTGTRSEAIDPEVAQLAQNLGHDEHGLCARIGLRSHAPLHQEENDGIEAL